MKKVPVKIVKWLANALGYEIAMIKVSGNETLIEGDHHLIKHVDIFNFTKDKNIKRRYKIR